MLNFHCEPELVLDKLYYRHTIKMLTTRLDLGLLDSESKVLKAKEILWYEAFLPSPHTYLQLQYCNSKSFAKYSEAIYVVIWKFSLLIDDQNEI